MADDFADDIKSLGDKIVTLTIGQAVQLGDYLEKVHGIKPAAGGAVVMAGPAGAAAAPVEEKKDEVTVTLDGVATPDKKISVIKVVREILGLGLAEAKAFVEGAPKPVKENITKAESEPLKKKLEDAGAKVSVK